MLDIFETREFSKAKKLIPEEIQRKISALVLPELVFSPDKKPNIMGKLLIAVVEGVLLKLRILKENEISYYAFIGNDFDGTISEITDAVDMSVPLPGTLDVNIYISDFYNIKNGILTGRELDYLLKFMPQKTPESFFMIGLHGLQTLDKGNIYLNISEFHKKKLDELRSIINEIKLSQINSIKIRYFEDKGGSISFHYPLYKNKEAVNAALKQALEIISKANIAIVKPESNKELLNQLKGIKINYLDKTSDEAFKIKTGSSLLEIIPAHADKGKTFKQYAFDYIKSIENKLETNPDARLLLIFNGDDVTDFDVIEKLELIKAEYPDLIEIGANYVINNRILEQKTMDDELKSRIQTSKYLLTQKYNGKYPTIYDNHKYLLSLNSILKLIKEYFYTS